MIALGFEESDMPDWFHRGVVFGEIPHSANYLVLQPDGNQAGKVFYADLIIGYKVIQETFSSRVTLDRPKHIHVEYLSGPMKYLSNHWNFIDNKDGTTTIDFFVEFEFKNPLLRKLMGVFFNEIVRRMVSAFEARAIQLYGKR